MKTLSKLLVIALLTVFYACHKNTVTPTALTGKWVHSAEYINPGGGGSWVPATNNTYVQFDVNGSLSGTAFPGFVNYVVKDSIIVTFTKSDKTAQGYQYRLHDGFLDLSPYPIICIEGCASRFTKQND